jgi:aminopeptidase YwaD
MHTYLVINFRVSIQISYCFIKIESMNLLVKCQTLFLCLLTLSSYLQAQPETQLIEKRLRHSINVLAHDSMFGREAGTSSEYKSALFIEESFRNSKLQPYDKASGSFLKSFEFGHTQFLKSKLIINGIAYTKGVDFGAIAGSSDGNIVSGKMIEYAEAYHNMIEHEENGFSGKVILLDMYSKIIGTDKGMQKSIQLINTCVLNGASAIILYGAWQKDFRDRLFNADSMPSFPLPIVYITYSVLKQVKKIKEKPACDIEVSIAKDRPVANNVIGFLDNGAKRTVVIGGHFDHVGTSGSQQPKIGDPGIHNGADDNASGTAGVMELARWASHEKNLKYNYLFIAFSAEEKGLYGSWNFCNSSDFRKYDIAWMLNLDMIGRLGWKGKDKLAVMGMASSKKWRTLLKKTSHEGLQLLKLKGAPGYSDHYPFLKHKVPVIYFTTGLEKEYHTPLDDPELINYRGEAVILEYLERLILNAEMIGDPGFHKVSGFQDMKALISEFVLKR